MKKYVSAAASALLVIELAACGGGGDGGSGGDSGPSAPSKITTTDQVAQVASALSGSLYFFEELGDDISFGISGSSAKSSVGFGAIKSRSAKFSGKSAAVRSKAAQPCKDGGTFDYTPDTTTPYSDDGTTAFANCKQNGSDTYNGVTYSYSDLVTGKASSKCTDSAQTLDACSADTTKIADGANGGSDLTGTFTYTDSSNASENQNETVVARGDISRSFVNTSDTYTSTYTVTGSMKFTDNISKFQASVVFDGLKNVSTGGTETIDGGFGVVTSKSVCSIGKVKIKTDSPLTYNSNYELIAGKMTVTDSAGQSATLEYASDSSVKVTLANGTKKTYTTDQIESACD